MKSTRNLKNLLSGVLQVGAVLVLLAPAAQARDWHVLAGANADGDGTTNKPLATISAAIESAKGGDTILVGSGIYREELAIDKAFSTDAPLTIRAAEGTQPVISGAAPVGNWKVWREGIYTTDIEGKAEDLLAGASRLPLSRWPREGQSWLQIGALDAAANRFAFSGEAPAHENASGLHIYAHSPGRNNYETYDASDLKVEAGGGSAAVSAKTIAELKSGKNKNFFFFNAPDFIRNAGEYALAPLPNGGTRFYYKPSSPRDLETTQTRRLSSAISLGTKCDNIRIMGFAVTAMKGGGINMNKVANVAIEDCVFYNNGSGISVSASSDVAIRRCVVARNYWGINVNASRNVQVEQTEVAFNDEDGVRVNGRIYDMKSGKIGMEGLNFKECYFHHQHYQGHPDNVQFFRGVGNGSFDKCLFLFGGQQIMAEQTENYKLSGSMFLASINRSLNLFTYKNPDAPAWNLESNTIGYTRYNPVATSGANGRAHSNVLFQFSQKPLFDATKLTFENNWHWPAVDGKFADMTGARHADPTLRNVPALMEIAYGSSSSTNERLNMDMENAASGFAIGDLIEVNGDGVARKVTAVEGKFISIAPALATPPFRYSFVFNWKNNPNFQLDARPLADSEAAKAGTDNTPVGSLIEIAQYQKGDFNGDGKRDLPPLPAELAAAMPTFANDYVYPYAL